MTPFAIAWSEFAGCFHCWTDVKLLEDQQKALRGHLKSAFEAGYQAGEKQKRQEIIDRLSKLL
jgi:hypothetical protein